MSVADARNGRPGVATGAVLLPLVAVAVLGSWVRGLRSRLSV